jgi:hypothetical protein
MRHYGRNPARGQTAPWECTPRHLARWLALGTPTRSRAASTVTGAGGFTAPATAPPATCEVAPTGRREHLAALRCDARHALHLDSVSVGNFVTPGCTTIRRIPAKFHPAPDHRRGSSPVRPAKIPIAALLLTYFRAVQLRSGSAVAPRARRTFGQGEHEAFGQASRATGSIRCSHDDSSVVRDVDKRDRGFDLQPIAEDERRKIA